MREAESDYDGAWKEALESYFAEFTAFFFPQAHAEIDWSRGYDFLDKELQRVAPRAELGPRRVDKLTKVWRQGGEEAWVLVYVEVQSQDETGKAQFVGEDPRWARSEKIYHEDKRYFKRERDCFRKGFRHRGGSRSRINVS